MSIIYFKLKVETVPPHYSLPYGKTSIVDAKEFYNFASKVFDKVCVILYVDEDL